jgi:plasmid maintenance system antidote protein VapI
MDAQRQIKKFCGYKPQNFFILSVKAGRLCRIIKYIYKNPIDIISVYRYNIGEVIKLSINEIITESGMTKYRLAKLSGVPHATLNDICSGKTRIEKCSGETLYKLAKALSVSMEILLESAMPEISIERSYEYGLPNYLQKDLDAYKEALKNGSTLLDCLWGELYGSINAAEISDGAITPAHADYLRQKFLWGQTV